jgi:TonB family protein
MLLQPARGRAPLRSKILGLLLCGLFLLSQAGAFQMSIQIEANEQGRKIKTRVNPEYPDLAVKARISGTARVQLTVSPEGTVKEVKELGGSPVLLAALVRAVKQWKYEAAPKESAVEVKAAFNR